LTSLRSAGRSRDLPAQPAKPSGSHPTPPRLASLGLEPERYFLRFASSRALAAAITTSVTLREQGA
jgi:hypothetical protein